MRRLRRLPALRDLVRETSVEPGDLLLPVFVDESLDGTASTPIGSMPGISRHSIDSAAAEAREAHSLGIAGVMLFGIPENKDADGSGAWAAHGVVQQATAAIKTAVPGLLVTTDLCLCEYTDHGHCGRLTQAGTVDNDATLDLLAQTAVSQAASGSDMLFPSDMMDGRIGFIRDVLDAAGHTDTPIAAHSAKMASAFYGPFREAAGSAPASGDRRGYQMDGANSAEAVREALMDVDEGADIVLVKPALPYLDVIAKVKQATGVPVAAYSVGGEYVMIKAAAAAGHLDERLAVLEALTSIRRAGADILITYHAKDAAGWLQ
jgi:porphobilinogen synthase